MSLIGWWKLDEGSGTSAADSAGSNTGTLTNATWAAGHNQVNAAAFDGSGDYVNIPHNSVLNVASGDFTAMAWVRPTAFADYDSVFGKGTELAFYLKGGSTGQVYYFVGGNGTQVTISPVATIGVWQHYVMKRNGNALKFYRNGILVGSATESATTTGSSDLKIGQAQGGADFNGRVADFRLYNTGLSQLDIEKIYGSIGNGYRASPIF